MYRIRISQKGGLYGHIKEPLPTEVELQGAARVTHLLVGDNMPRVLLDPKNDKFRELKVLINGNAAADKKDPEAIAAAIGVSRNTVYKYLRYPEKAPYEKLIKLCRYVNVPIEKLRECIRY